MTNLPKRLRKDGRSYLPKRHHKTIAVDSVLAGDLRIFAPRIFCDDCSHYSASETRCTIGYRAQHTRAEQMALYERTGKIAFCRAMEID